MALVVKNSPANAGDVRDTGSIPGSGRSPGGGMATQYFKRNLLNLYREGKNIASLFPPGAQEREKCLTLAGYFLCLETPGLPACYPLMWFTINCGKF